MKPNKKKPSVDEMAAERQRKERALRDGIQKLILNQIPLTIRIPQKNSRSKYGVYE
jgi:hypothetical protein